MSGTKNPPEIADTADIVNLIHSDQPDILENLRLRHAQQHVYTAVSHIILALNPYKRHPIYGSDKIAKIKHAIENHKPIDPHVYAISSRALEALVSIKQSQSIIISGESGAGKTENSKRAMEYLTAQSSSQQGLEERILECNPILESFGNAKTLMNNNSSRFGKFTKIIFDKNFDVGGALIESYLLEKSRICLQEANERNYHAFYMAYEKYNHDPNFSFQNGLESFQYVYGNTNGNQALQVPGRNEQEMVDELDSGFNSLNFTSTEQQEIYEAVASILHLGNITFEESDSGVAKIKMESNTSMHIDTVSKLLQISTDALLERLQKKSIKVGLELIKADLNVSDAFENRDALSKTIFHRLFLWLVEKCGEQLSAGLPDDDNQFYIGILDVFGFEMFQNNSFEQFCINYCNEVLQQYFNESVISSEQEEYLKEGLPWNELNLPDNQPMMNLISHSKKGIFALTDSACNMPKATAATLHDSVMRTHKKHPLIKNSKRKKEKGFIITHYAGVVDYQVTQFMAKNTDTIHSDTIKLLASSKSSVCKNMMQKDIKNAKRKKKSFQGVGTYFNGQLSKLMKGLKTTKSWFLRCLNPNRVKSATEWDETHMIKQLKCNGILEAVKVIKLGYPSRCTHEMIVTKFVDSGTQNLKNNPIRNFDALDNRKKLKCLLLGLDIKESEYELGFTKVFFRPNDKRNVLAELQTHSGLFDDSQIKRMSRAMKLSHLFAVTGLIKTYNVFASDFIEKEKIQLRNNFIACTCMLAKFASFFKKKNQQISAAEAEAAAQAQAQTEASQATDHYETQQNTANNNQSESNMNNEPNDDHEAGSPENDDTESDEDESSDYGDDDSSGYDDSEEDEDSDEEESNSDDNDDKSQDEKEKKVSATDQKIIMLVQAWAVNSVIGEKFFKYGRKGYPHERTVQVSLDGENIVWGSGKFETKKITEIRVGAKTDVFKKHKNVVDDVCFSIITTERTLDLQAARKGQRNVWVAALRLLISKGKAGMKFKKLRASHLAKRAHKKKKK